MWTAAVGATVRTVGTGAVIGAVVVPTIAVVGIHAVGFGAGSWAASLMSSTSVANGGAIAAGSTFAALQSVGAVGVSAVWSFAGAAAGAAGAAVGLLRRK